MTEGLSFSSSTTGVQERGGVIRATRRLLHSLIPPSPIPSYFPAHITLSYHPYLIHISSCQQQSQHLKKFPSKSMSFYPIPFHTSHLLMIAQTLTVQALDIAISASIPLLPTLESRTLKGNCSTSHTPKSRTIGRSMGTPPYHL